METTCLPSRVQNSHDCVQPLTSSIHGPGDGSGARGNWDDPMTVMLLVSPPANPRETQVHSVNALALAESGLPDSRAEFPAAIHAWVHAGNSVFVAGYYNSNFIDAARYVSDPAQMHRALVAALASERSGRRGEFAAAVSELRACGGTRLAPEVHAAELQSWVRYGDEGGFKAAVGAVRCGVPCDKPWSPHAAAVMLLGTVWKPGPHAQRTLALLHRYLDAGMVPLDADITVDFGKMSNDERSHYANVPYHEQSPLALALRTENGPAAAALIDRGAVQLRDYRAVCKRLASVYEQNEKSVGAMMLAPLLRKGCAPGASNLEAFHMFAEATMFMNPEQIAHVTAAVMRQRMAEVRKVAPDASAASPSSTVHASATRARRAARL